MTYPDHIAGLDRGYVEFFYDAAVRMISKVNQEGQDDYGAYGRPVVYTADGDAGTEEDPNDWWDGDETTATVSAKGLPYLFTGREYDLLDEDGGEGSGRSRLTAEEALRGPVSEVETSVSLLERGAALTADRRDR